MLRELCFLFWEREVGWIITGGWLTLSLNGQTIRLFLQIYIQFASFSVFTVNLPLFSNVLLGVYFRKTDKTIWSNNCPIIKPCYCHCCPYCPKYLYCLFYNFCQLNKTPTITELKTTSGRKELLLADKI